MCIIGSEEILNCGMCELEIMVQGWLLSWIGLHFELPLSTKPLTVLFRMQYEAQFPCLCNYNGRNMQRWH